MNKLFAVILLAGAFTLGCSGNTKANPNNSAAATGQAANLRQVVHKESRSRAIGWADTNRLIGIRRSSFFYNSCMENEVPVEAKMQPREKVHQLSESSDSVFFAEHLFWFSKEMNIKVTANMRA